jgi:prepilin-type N-terminal cleavage/methylation domain-containing protein
MTSTPRVLAGWVARATRAAVRPRRAARGMTLLEILVAVAIMLAVTAVLAPSLSAALELEERGAVRKLALTLEHLHDEAILRNRTYRLTFNLRQHEWKVEAGDADVLVFSSAEAREAYEEREADLQVKMTPEERAAAERHAQFAAADADVAGPFPLPEGIRFKLVKTPQYKDPVVPPEAAPKLDKPRKEGEPDPFVASAYLFANGFAEHLIVQFVDADDPDSGWTVTMDPLSGRVSLVSELTDVEDDAFDFLPKSAPQLSL